MTSEIISVLIGLPFALWVVFGCFLYAKYSLNIDDMNKKQFVLIVFASGPLIWLLIIFCILLTLLSYLESPLRVIGKWFHNFYLYLGNIETKRIKCPYCNLKPLQSTIRRYGMCGLCHKHGKGYNNKERLKK